MNFGVVPVNEFENTLQVINESSIIVNDTAQKLLEVLLGFFFCSKLFCIN